MLARTLYGSATDQPPLVIAHGLFGSGRNWGVIAKRLSDARLVVTLDMRNHGASPWAEAHDYPALAEDLAEVLAELGTPCALLGHSMGGKAAMVCAATHPTLLRRLIVADIAPVGYGHTQMHLIDAMQEIGADFPTRTAADAALSAHVTEPGVRSFLLQSLDMVEKRWRLNLDVLRREMDAILSFPKLTGQFTGPTLFLSGGASAYVRPEHRAGILELFPDARFASIPGAGHWLHAEKPREVEVAVREFLEG